MQPAPDPPGTVSPGWGNWPDARHSATRIPADIPGGDRVDAAVTGWPWAVLVADVILAGLSLDKVIVHLPARRRISVTAYAAYARAADLGNGLAYYAAAGVGAAALTFGVRRGGGTGSTPGSERAAGCGCGVVPTSQCRDGASRSHHVSGRQGRRHRCGPGAVAGTICPLVSGTRGHTDRDAHSGGDRGRRGNLTDEHRGNRHATST